jgi:hypothetical protein
VRACGRVSPTSCPCPSSGSRSSPDAGAWLRPCSRSSRIPLGSVELAVRDAAGVSCEATWYDEVQRQGVCDAATGPAG